MRPVAIVTGAAGLIGQYLVRNARRWAPEWEVRGVSRADLDLTDFPAVRAAFRTWHPDAVIHCAALSRTKDCELHPERARAVNVEATAYLAELARDRPFFLISSGEVFDGRRGWYKESDKASPLNVYGKTKLEAEQLVLSNARHSVIRIVLTAGTSQNQDRSFVEDMCRAAKEGKPVTLYADEFRCPLPAGAIARAIWELLGHARPGLYHLGGSERLSRWEIGQALAAWYPQLDGCLVQGTSQLHVGAPRPADLSLACDKLQSLLSFPIPGFRSWLASRSASSGDIWDYPS